MWIADAKAISAARRAHFTVSTMKKFSLRLLNKSIDVSELFSERSRFFCLRWIQANQSNDNDNEWMNDRNGAMIFRYNEASIHCNAMRCKTNRIAWFLIYYSIQIYVSDMYAYMLEHWNAYLHNWNPFRRFYIIAIASISIRDMLCLRQPLNSLKFHHVT